MRRSVATLLICLFVTACFAVVPEGTPEKPTVPAGQSRSDKAQRGGNLRYWPKRGDAAEVVTASFLGGAGEQWLVDGGFQPDGSMVLVGNGVGGNFALPVRMTVLGRDGSKPDPYKPRQRMSKARRRQPSEPVTDALGNPEYQKLSWTMDDATGFLVKLDPSLRKIQSAARLGWATGVITAAVVGTDGSVYIAGRAGSGAKVLANDSQVARSQVQRVKGAPADKTFVAKVAADLSRVLWVRVVEGDAFAPRLTLRADGSIVASLADLRTYSPAGKLLSTVVVDGGLGDRNSVNPITGEIVYGGEHHWSTGREPWRCPILDVKNPDGSLKYKLMDWGGPYVGLDNQRLVSDTAVRRVSHDSKGNIVAILWSDGGNSVGGRQVTDVRRGVGTRGVGLTTAGANATSFAWLMRIEPENYQVIGWTLWCSNYGHKANGANITRTSEADDGSLCFAGGSAWGLRQTPNRLTATEPGGDYIAVLTPDLTGVRYSSIVPGTGRAEVSGGNDWGIFTGVQNGRQRAVFVTGAGKSGDNYGLVTETPTTDNALQKTFGGGTSDGWFIVLDLSKPVAPARPAQTGGGRMTYQRAGHRVGRNRKRETTPENGTVYTFDPKFPRWVTVDAEFRHPDPAAHWPNFFYGRPVSGKLTWSSSGVTGQFEVQADRLVQNRGSQARRVLGQLLEKVEDPGVKLTVKSLGDPKTERFETTDKKGRKITEEVTYQVADAVLEVAGRRLNVQPKVTISPGKVVEKPIQKLTVTAWLSLTGRQLGLAGKLADEPIDIRISAQAMQEGSDRGRKRR